MKHVFHQNDSILSKQVLTEQLKNNWSGLSKDAYQIEDILGVSGVFDVNVTKSEYKVRVRKACIRFNDEDLKRKISEYKKMKALRDESSKGNKYFFKESLQNVRTLFRFRVELFQAKMNFKQNTEYKRENYLCDSCQTEVDENVHVLFCDSYKSLREGLDINNDQHLSWYLQRVMEIRTELRLTR